MMSMVMIQEKNDFNHFPCVLTHCDSFFSLREKSHVSSVIHIYFKTLYALLDKGKF